MWSTPARHRCHSAGVRFSDGSYLTLAAQSCILLHEATASLLSVYALIILIACSWRNRQRPFAASANASMRQRRHFIRRKAVASDAANGLCASPYATALSGATCHLTLIFCVNSYQSTYQRRTEPIPEAGFQPEGITLLMQAAAPSA
ncbi:hypothetical protein [Lonsdalea quercina]|uniref:hypothetical protein n=1 Tax=Lonsdalea quercina TaxID=71657 RepID=UPI003974EA60